ncbi:MAG: cyclic nucleotide-binding domain-containing protein [Deltaproteobacteria bacterium]
MSKSILNSRLADGVNRPGFASRSLQQEITMKTVLPDFTKYSDFFDKQNIKKYPAGEYIFHMGDKANCMFVVIDGKVEIASGKRVLSIIEKGDIFGDMALIDNSPRSADVRAFTDCTLASLDEYAFKFLVKKIPDFTLDIMRVMSNRLRSLNSVLPSP